MGIDAALGITAAFFAVVVLSADEHAEFSLNHAVMLMRVLHNPFAEFNIFCERFVASIDHHAGKAFIDALLAKLKAVSVIEVDSDRNRGKTHRRFNQLFEVNGMGILTRSARDLQHDRGFFLFTGLDDGLEQFHVVYVESPEGVFSFERLSEQFFGVGQWHISLSSASSDETLNAAAE
jgi:hypothetical protein